MAKMTDLLHIARLLSRHHPFRCFRPWTDREVNVRGRLSALIHEIRGLRNENAMLLTVPPDTKEGRFLLERLEGNAALPDVERFRRYVIQMERCLRGKKELERGESRRCGTCDKGIPYGLGGMVQCADTKAFMSVEMRCDEWVWSEGICRDLFGMSIEQVKKELADNAWRVKLCGECGHSHAEFPRRGIWGDLPHAYRKGKWFCINDPDGTHPSSPDDEACPAWKPKEGGKP